MTKHIKTITLEQLQDMEQQEYKTLEQLSHLQYMYEREGNTERAEQVAQSVNWTRGRWGMLMDLIEQLEK